ncbi:methylmalonyl-CoA mutase family protein [Jonquetella anthropi]|uniref:methylmalonyl-CoA mutase family protein n=1 Tax=Jonquetella anthropi TaxID=428712 RepID=UPI0001B911DF|nr:methylmalonyl-CoA mutase family protein [Jonquetella anthropi]EEX48536.1 putative methylmalonyl-CoA mutase, small subunit [Jonquetella anthropi E3_33 E1]
MANDEKSTDVQHLPDVTFDEFPKPTFDEWKEAVEKLLKGAPFEKKMFTKTYEGIVLNGMYWGYDIDGLENLDSAPGEAPYLRGCFAGGYEQHPWGIAQACEYAGIADAHSALCDELKKGADVINIALDEGTRRCFDEPLHQNGRAVSLATADELDQLTDGIDLTAYPLHVNAGCDALPFYALLRACMACRGQEIEKLSGCIGADPLSELAQWGRLDEPLETALDHMAQLARTACQSSPKLRTVIASGTPYADGGASAVQELALTIASAAFYVRVLMDRGLSADEASGQIRFRVSLGANFFMEIAKLRALRVLWSTVSEAFGAGAEAQKAQVMASTSSFTATTYDPYVNILRATTQAFSGIVGGLDLLQINPFDRTVRPSTEQARRIARNQQIMFRTEFNMTTPVDPAGGSWFVEKLTSQVAEKAWSLFQAVEAEGGILESLKHGTVQSSVNETLCARFKALSSRKDRAVGINMYANMAETPLEPSTFDPEAFKASRLQAVAEHKKARPAQVAEESLRRLADDVSVENAVQAAENGATIGEIAGTWRRADDLSVEPIAAHHWTEQFEALRKRTEDWVAAGNENVKVFLCNMGPIPQHKPRADFSRGFMEVAHFQVIGNDGFATPEEAAAAALESGAHVAIICSTDATYPELVPPTARAIKAGNPNVKVILAGAPAPEMKDAYVEAGVDEFIHVKADCLSILTAIQKERGIC